MLILNFPLIYNFLEVELRACDHGLRTMIEYFSLTVRYFIYSIPKAKCRPGHLNVHILNMPISHSLHLQSLHHNPNYHQHQHQGDLTLGWCLNLWCQQRSAQVFHREQRVQNPLPLLRHVQHKPYTTVETFSIDKGDGSENVTFKNELAFFPTLSRLFQFTENS